MTRFTPSRLGIVPSLAAGVAFAVPPVIGQRALEGGTSIAAMLGWRHAIAAAVLAAIVRGRLRAIPLRTAGLAFGIGAGLYAADAALFFAALDRTSAPFATLLHYTHLVVVVGTMALVGRERLDVRRAVALVGVLLGVALVGGGGAVDTLGIVLALGAAAAYAAYILASDRLLRDVDPMAFATVLFAGSATAFFLFGASTGQLTSLGGGTGVAAVLVGALIGSVFAVSAFLSGIRLVGAGTASLLVTVEVPAGLVLAAIFLGERLTVVQQVGAALVVAAIAILELRIRRPRQRLAQVYALPASSSGGEPADAALAA